MDDSKIKDQMRNDPRRAVESILNKYGGALFSVIKKIVGSQEVAEDVLQDASLKIWKNAKSYDDSKGRLFTWLLSIARNTALDLVRTRKFNENRKSQSLEGNVYDNIGHSEEMKIADVGLLGVIDRLEPKYREVIDLLYLRGYTQKEVQEVLQIPLGTVKTRARAGIRQLRKLLKEQ